VLADETGDAEMIATDLLAQAEHDVRTRVGLITTDRALGPRRWWPRWSGSWRAQSTAATVAAPAWRDYGEVAVCAG
jgi:sulfopropanediol 3-dehydrogenase